MGKDKKHKKDRGRSRSRSRSRSRDRKERKERKEKKRRHRSSSSSSSGSSDDERHKRRDAKRLVSGLAGLQTGRRPCLQPLPIASPYLPQCFYCFMYNQIVGLGTEHCVRLRGFATMQGLSETAPRQAPRRLARSSAANCVSLSSVTDYWFVPFAAAYQQRFGLGWVRNG